MNVTEESIGHKLAGRIESLRRAQALSLDEAAEKTCISRATLSRLERGETSPTATQLGRICTAYQITMSGLFAEVEANPAQHVPLESQSVWSDPNTGFVRRSVLPPASGYRSEIIHGEIASGGVIAYAAAPAPGFEQYMVVERGALRFNHAGESFVLNQGDALRFRLTGSTCFENAGDQPVRYLVVLTKA